jgi:hypothetical protein
MGIIAVRPWRVVWVTADMQSAVPLSLLFSFLAPPAMLCTDCCCFAHREEHSPGSRTCGPLPIAFLRANLQLSPLLILCSLLLCVISHSMDAMSMPCAGVRARGWRGAGERAFKFAAGMSRATNTLLNPLNADYIFKTALITLINALAVPKSALFQFGSFS